MFYSESKSSFLCSTFLSNKLGRIEIPGSVGSIDKEFFGFFQMIKQCLICRDCQLAKGNHYVRQRAMLVTFDRICPTS